MTKVKNSTAFQIQRTVMTMTGAWPQRSPTIFYRVYGVIHYLTVITSVFSLFLCTFFLTDGLQLIHSWAMFATLLNLCVKIFIFHFKSPAFLDLLDFLHSTHFTYHNDKYDPHLQRIIRFATVLVKLFIFSGFVSIVTIVFGPLLNSQGSRLTPLPFPVDLNTQPFSLFVLVYVFQSLSIISAGWTSIGFDNLPTSMMGLCSGYCIILRKSIEDVTEPQWLYHGSKGTDAMQSYAVFDEIVNSKLNIYVEHHLAVIKFAKSIEDIFTFVFLSQFVASAAGIGLVGFIFVSTAPGSVEFMFALTFLCTLIFQITLYCFYGNEVTVQSGKIGDACYMTEWIYCGPVVRKTMFLIMERSKRPLVLTAGNFVNLSLTSLVNVVKSAGSYAAVLIQLYHK